MDMVTKRLYSSAPPKSVVLLVYHGTVLGSEATDSKYAIPAGWFQEHLDFLNGTSWKTVLPKDCFSRDHDESRMVVITFDDGYEDNYEGAFQPLVERGMVATWSLVSGKLGKHADWSEKANNGSRPGSRTRCGRYGHREPFGESRPPKSTERR